MSIAAVGDTSQSLFSILQKLQENKPTTSTSPLTTAASATTPTSSSTADASPIVQPAGHHRHHGKGSHIFKQIQDAVTSALQSSKDAPAGDANQTIEDAIAGVLKSNPDVLQAFQSRLSQTTGTPTDGTQPPKVLPGPQGASSTDSNRQAFQQLLQSFGIDPTQFRNDFLNAIKDAQNGQVNTASALQSVPAGTSLDIAA